MHVIFNDTMTKISISWAIVEDVGPDSEGMSVSYFLAWNRQMTHKSLSVALLASLWTSGPLKTPEEPVYVTLRLQEILTYSNTFLTGPRFSRSTN